MTSKNVNKNPNRTKEPRPTEKWKEVESGHDLWLSWTAMGIFYPSLGKKENQSLYTGMVFVSLHCHREVSKWLESKAPNCVENQITDDLLVKLLKEVLVSQTQTQFAYPT